jgi:hypothetical protein
MKRSSTTGSSVVRSRYDDAEFDILGKFDVNFEFCNLTLKKFCYLADASVSFDRSSSRSSRRERSNSDNRRRSRSRDRNSRDGDRRRRRSRSRSPRHRSPIRQPKRQSKQKESFIEEMMNKFPEMKNEIVLQNNMIALQEFGQPNFDNFMSQYPQQQPQSNIMYDQFGMPIATGFQPQIQVIPNEMLMAQIPLEPVPMPSTDIHPLVPAMSNTIITIPDENFEPVTTPKKSAEPPILNIEDAAKKVRLKFNFKY